MTATPANPAHGNNFDGLRLLAAAQVMLVHTSAHLDVSLGIAGPLVHLLPGVPVFFAMSGFLISASWERSASPSRYAANRLLRILPGLWAVIAATVVVAAFLGHAGSVPETARWALLQAGGLIYTPAFLQDFGFGSYNGSLWTIPLELQFYLLLPVLYLVGARGAGTTRMVLVALGTSLVFATIVAGIAPPAGGPEPLGFKLLRYTFAPHVYLFLAGVALQRLALHRHRALRGKGLWWLAGYLVVALALSQAGGAGGVAWSAWLRPLQLAALGVVAISLAHTLPELGHRLLRGVDISYGTYLFHGLVINAFVEAGRVGRWSDALAVMTIALLCGAASRHFVEMPALRLKPGADGRGAPQASSTLPMSPRAPPAQAAEKVPEPGASALSAIGPAGVGAAARRRAA